jgi:hypothetical protein
LFRLIKSAFFHFRSAEIGLFFCEAASETRNQKLGKTSHINSRPAMICVSALICCRSLQRYILNFAQDPADFGGTEVVLHFSAKKLTSRFFFAKIIFGSKTCHFSTKI